MKYTALTETLAGPLLIFGGPYSNLEATQAIQAEAQRLGIPSTNVICTGDIVAYCSEPEATAELIRNWGIKVVQGNCEYAIGHDENDCGCGFEAGSECAIASNEWFVYTRKHVSEQTKQWMRDLPENIRLTYYGLNIVCVHGGLEQQNQFIFGSTKHTLKQEQLAAAEADVMIGGHCGLPFGHALETVSPNQNDKMAYWLNAGVIGMPANDGTPRTWYMLLEPSSIASQSESEQDSKAENIPNIKVSWHALAYAHQASIKKMQEVRLASSYQASMSSGLWPNMDILPEAERQAVGLALAPEPINISALPS